ncbi:MAG: recombinase family protein [Chlamydiae bacterium]|nr:recombinase family protein [Chlamydiota bacterium]
MQDKLKCAVYTRVSTDNQVEVEFNSCEAQKAKIVRDIFESYISSQSLSKVYEHLKTMVRTDISFSKSRISYILRNIIYTGKLNYGGKIYQGNHPALISDEIFNLAQEVHKEKVRSLRLYKNYSLTGLITCQECGSFMTPCHSNKMKNGKRNRYYYYRCTKTFKKDWNACGTKQVNANRLEDYIFQNLERISLDKHYLDSLVFKINNSNSGGHAGLELSAESSKICPEIVEGNLKTFVKGLSGRHGIERNLWAKKFIKKIKYGKDEIELSLYY